MTGHGVDYRGPAAPMSKAEAEREMREVFATIAVAQAMLEPHRAFLDRFEDEARAFESVGPIFDPTLFKRAQAEPWRNDIRAIVRAARVFVDAVGEHRSRMQAGMAGAGGREAAE